MKKMAGGGPVGAVATIDDPAILDEIEVALGALGYPSKAGVDRE